MRLQVCQADIIRITYTNASSLPSKTSLSVNASWGTPSFCVTEAAGVLTITTSRMKAKVTESTGLVSYTDLNDNALVSEYSKSLTAATVEGVATNTVAAAFNSPTNEALFGLGQHQDGVINRKGSTLRMLNANTEIQIPVLVSNKGYGLFWDNYSTTNFAGNVSGNTRYSFSAEAGDLVDYYFFYGPTIDQVIANYRTATGPAPLFPKWAYGLFQSKDHYQSSAELTAVQNGYRNNNIPVDVIVQDWQYWSPAVWGSHLMDAGRFPDPAAIVRQLHTANIHTMISIWPLYQTRSNGVATVAGELDNYNALNAINALYPTTTANGTYHFYDTFNATARTLVYQQSYDRLIGKYGWDAIWADNTEPQSYPEGVNVHAANTALGKGALLHQRLPASTQQGGLRGLAQGGAEQQARLHPHPQRVRGPAALRGGLLVGGHQRHPERLHRADPGGPGLRDLRDAVLDHRHRRLLRNPERGALHPLVPVRRLQPAVPHPRTGAQGAVRFAVERDGQGQHARRRQSALSLDAVHLFAGLEDHQRRLHDDAPAGLRLSERHDGLRHQGPVHVRARAAGQSGHRDGRDQPVGLSAGGDLVRLLDGIDDGGRNHRRRPARR